MVIHKSTERLKVYGAPKVLSQKISATYEAEQLMACFEETSKTAKDFVFSKFHIMLLLK